MKFGTKDVYFESNTQLIIKIPGGFKMRSQVTNYQNLMSRMIAVILISMFMLPGLMAQNQELAVLVPLDAVAVYSANSRRAVTEAVQEERIETENWMQDTESWGNPVSFKPAADISEKVIIIEDWMRSTVLFGTTFSTETALKIEDWMVKSVNW